MKKLLCAILIIVQLISVDALASTNYAKENDVPFFVVTENIDDEISILGWVRSYTSNTIVTLWVGEIDNPIYIKETYISSDGSFLFGFEPSDDVPPGKYKYRICSNSEMEVYESYLHYDGKTKQGIEHFVDALFGLSTNSYIPTFSGLISCDEDVTTTFSLVNAANNYEYINKTIEGGSDEIEFEFKLPTLNSSFNHNVSLLCRNKHETLLDISVNISYGTYNNYYAGFKFEGHINMSGDVKNEIDFLIQETFSDWYYGDWYYIEKSQPVSLTVPNVMYSVDSYLHFYGKKFYEYENTNDVIMFENRNLYHKLREYYPNFDSDLDRIITSWELQSITGTLDLSDIDITSVVGLEHCKNIHTLDISSNNITDISRLNELDKLQILYANNNKIESITKLPKNLKYVDLSNNLITSVENQNEYNSITFFNAVDNNISSISGLSKNTNLRYLDLSNNNITDISPLSDCSRLAHLDMSSNSITDVSPLRDNNAIAYLDLSDNNISDISELPDIRYNTMNLQNNYISGDDISQFTAINKAYLPVKQN